MALRPDRTRGVDDLAAARLRGLADHQHVADVLADGQVREERLVREEGVDRALERQAGITWALCLLAA
jgi:hypothetical protein